MKRTLALLLALTLLLALLPGCGQDAAQPDPLPPEPDVPAAELAESAFRLSGYGEELNTEALDSDLLTTYIEAVFGLTADQWEDGAVIRGTRASAFEIVVLRLPDEDAAAQAETAFADYLPAREGAFTGYAPAEAEMVSNGKVLREGRTAGLFICPDPEGAGAAFTAVCNGGEPPAPPEPAPEPEPAEEPFQPAFLIYDLLHRLLLEAACPEWGSPGMDRGWSSGKSNWSDAVEVKYGITADQYEDYATAHWGPQAYELFGMPDGPVDENFDLSQIPVVERNVHEIVLFQTATEDGAKALAQALNAYKDARLAELEEKEIEGEEHLEEYAQTIRAEAAALADAQAVSSDCYAALIVSEHMADAILLFPRAVNDPETNGYFQRYIGGVQAAPPTDPDPDYPDRVRFTPPEDEDMTIYDTSAILAAWESKDPSALSGDDRAIYDAAEALLAEIMADGMTDLEKEKAAYDWLVENVNYDWSHMNILDETARRAYGPYGGLVDRSAVCLGYATSFQLLMDMSGVECITVVGAGSNSTASHAWNQVKLNGEWYCTDVAWDANARELADDHDWRYFNLTSDEMAKKHQWDYRNTPEATAEDRGQS